MIKRITVIIAIVLMIIFALFINKKFLNKTNIQATMVTKLGKETVMIFAIIYV